MKDLIGLDFETYGAVDLKRHGLQRYTEDCTFRPLIASATYQDHHGNIQVIRFDWVGNDWTDTTRDLKAFIADNLIAAHNAGFEQRVLSTIGIHLPSSRFLDTAVIARAAGAAGKLEAAAPQLLNTDKVEAGLRLIKLFSIPGKYQADNGSMMFDPEIVADHPDEWSLFKHYCDVDSELGLHLGLDYGHLLSHNELKNMAITMDMNLTGWHVDIEKVEEMQRRYLENQAVALENFRSRHDAADLNLNSLPQLKAWCAERGIKATSFDEKNVAKMVDRISNKLLGMLPSDARYEGYEQVLELLETKQILGGSSLKKLQVILDTLGADGRLRDQYLHVGAGQTWRTTGRSVQMQNLKRLGSEVDDMAELDELDVEWDNDKLAKNIRQLFTATHPDGALIVGDFSSVEARGLCWLADDQPKLEAYRKDLDMYKVLAADMFGVRYDDVTKEQRQAGKVGVLSCGYGAGAGAVQAFAEGMGIVLSEGEASKLVTDWRAANPKVVALWDDLDAALHHVVESGDSFTSIQIGWRGAYRVRLYRDTTPDSLKAQHPGAVSVGMEVLLANGTGYLNRVFHGCHVRGRNIGYYKPSERKTGDLWVNHFTDPKTKQVKFFSLYGGKLAGILTQSFCRELFFGSLRMVKDWTDMEEGLALVGQFHDEIVVEWTPGHISLELAKAGLGQLMSNAGPISGFPLAADIKHDYRYTK